MPWSNLYAQQPETDFVISNQTDKGIEVILGE
jgi:hypothetical protein